MTMQRPWFILAGGGTGGHLYPGLAVAEAFQKLQPDVEVTVYGTGRPIDKRLTDDRGYGLVVQEVRAFPSRPWHIPGFLLTWRRSVKKALADFQSRRPAVVLGLGGYAAGPAVVAAAKLGVPVAIFNPDAVPGRANRRLARHAQRIFVQWDETRHYFPESAEVRVTGCPIRPSFSKATRDHGCRLLKIDPDKHTVLITGASQGARSINLAAMELMELWQVAQDWQVVHLTGVPDLETCRVAYEKHNVTAKTLAFTEHMAFCMAASDVIISRAGASTLAEITAMGLPSILLPYPFDRKQHQRKNAEVLVKNNAAVLVDDLNDPKLNARQLREELRDIMRSEERRRQMSRRARALGRTGAADDMASQLFEMAGRGA